MDMRRGRDGQVTGSLLWDGWVTMETREPSQLESITILCFTNIFVCLCLLLVFTVCYDGFSWVPFWFLCVRTVFLFIYFLVYPVFSVLLQLPCLLLLFRCVLLLFCWLLLLPCLLLLFFVFNFYFTMRFLCVFSII